MRYGFGIDILGTHIRLGFFEETGKLLEKWELTLPGFQDSSQIVPTIAEEVERYLSQKRIFEDDVIGIGVGVPGPVSNSGVVNKCVNISWGVFNLERALSGLTGLHVKASNTANLSALGEYWQDPSIQNMVFMVMNAGLGGGIVCDGMLINGANGGAGEIGHIVVNKEETEACSCGRYGCVEQYCSPKGIVRVARRQMNATRTPSVLRNRRFFDFRDVLQAAATGDKLAKDVMTQVYDHAGHALASVCCVTNPDTVVLGGEFCRIGQPAIDGISWAFRKYVFHANEGVRFRMAALGQDDVLYGAFKLVCDTFAQ